MPQALIDCHHHIWRQSDLAWLQGPMVPRIFGPYESVRRDYPVEEYIAEATAAGVTGSIYVQTNWPAGDELKEVQWVQQVHEATGWPMAMVSYADLFDPGAVDMLQRQKRASPLVKGARIQLHWHVNPTYRFAKAADALLDPVLDRNLKMLPALGLTFDLQVFSGQMHDAARLVARHPELTFVIVHAGMLESDSSEEVTAWKRGMAKLAALPNVWVKLTGQGTFVHRIDVPLMTMVTSEVIEAFGHERLMWGSNFPIEKIWTNYGALVAAWKTVLSQYPQAVQDAIFGSNARRLYGI